MQNVFAAQMFSTGTLIMGRCRAAASMVSGGFAAAAATTATGMAKNSHRRGPLGPTGTSAARWSHHFFPPPPAHTHTDLCHWMVLPTVTFCHSVFVQLSFNTALFYRSSLYCNYYIGVSFSLRCCSSPGYVCFISFLSISSSWYDDDVWVAQSPNFSAIIIFPLVHTNTVQHSIGIFFYISP